MKKIISLMLAMVLMCGCLVGCGKKGVEVIKDHNAKGTMDRVYDISAKEFAQLFNKNLPDSKWKIGELKQGQTTEYFNYQSYDYGNGFSVVFVTLKDSNKLYDIRVVANLEQYDELKFEKISKHLVLTLDPTLKEDQQTKLWEELQINNSKKWSKPDESNSKYAKGIQYFIYKNPKDNTISFLVSPLTSEQLDIDQLF